MTITRALSALLLAGLLAGCSSSAPTETPRPDPRSECEAAAASVVDAVAELVRQYDTPLVGPSGQSDATAAPEPDDTAAPGSDDTVPPDERLAAAVAEARRVRAEKACPTEPFDDALATGLRHIDAEAPLADAVLRRTSSSLLGDARRTAEEHELTADEDLRDVLASAADGTTVVLPEGTIDVDFTVVALSGVTLRGAGRDATTIRSTAPDAAVVVATPANVRLEGLTLALSSGKPASGVVAGPSASLALTDVRISGAKAEGEGAGGAGLYLSAMGDEGSGRGTTLQVTDSVFEDNAWVGVAVSGGHRVSIEASSFARNATAGILFLDVSSGSVAGSEFTDNGVGLAAAGAATPVWTDSTIHGGGVGAQVDGTAAPRMTDLRITGSRTAAVIFGARAQGWITGVSCEGVAHGIVVADTAAPSLGENRCAVARGAS